ncbi:diacylglycerol kinase family lipid kinase [Mucilaginibacter sp. SMC90]|uniref:diacylglycerol/lipid kinase family protein n=1 Tax=Mucilaginibacter sp. SMC90 TaxID=2929803 RepID=UPI001FB510A3|nr:diacylglycerol kinase family protein [Mucilaginibacter sp. SMC90]UOE52498.1 diacylglycerol kinase family lipid kinase [Mucilaginibacter sp. SMC90]
MKFKHIHFIINPASGKEEPILSFINRVFADSKTDWDVSLTKKNCSAGQIAKSLIGKTDLVAVYGGDGCVTAAAAALHGTQLPIAIIPGGTANVMAKDLGVPLDTLAALELIKSGKHQVKAIDMGLVNGEPFLLRVNLGIMADMVTTADRGLKNKLGQVAYGVTALQTAIAAEQVDYELKIDSQQISASGVALTVTNSGNIGIGDLDLLPGISVTDGWLDVILMKDNDWLNMLKIAGSTLLQNDSETLVHWRCKKVSITAAKKQSYICDDAARSAKKLKIEVVPGSVHLLVPQKKK